MDGRLFKDSPLTSIVNGQVANVPFATGVRVLHVLSNYVSRLTYLQDCDDEGTEFTMALLNLT